MIPLETQDVNNSYGQTMHDYYNQWYNTKTEEYVEKAAEKSKNNMYNNILDSISAFVQQPACDPPIQAQDPTKVYQTSSTLS